MKVLITTLLLLAFGASPAFAQDSTEREQVEAELEEVVPDEPTDEETDDRGDAAESDDPDTENTDTADDDSADDDRPDEAATPDDDPFDQFEEFGPDEIDRGPLRSDGRPLELMRRSELEDSGFEFGAQADSVDRSTAFLLSLSAGVAFHGVGHFYTGDTRSGFLLLGMEIVSLGLMGSSAIFYGLTEGSSPAAAFFSPALQLGVAGFIYSYLLDVIGSLQGDDLRMADNTAWERGVGVRARYGFFQATGLPMRHLIDAALMIDVGAVYGRAGTTQDIFLDASSYRGRVGVRPLRARDPLTFVSVEGGVDYFQWQGTGEFGRLSVDGRLGVSYQLGLQYPNFDQFAIAGEVGLGNDWYQFAPQGSTNFETASSRLWVPFDVNASMNVSRRLNIRGGYGSPKLSYVPAIHRMLGVAHLDFLYRSTSYGDITLRTEIGDGFAVWLGGSLWFGR